MTLEFLNSLTVDQSWLAAALGIGSLIGKLAGKMSGNRAGARAAEAELNSKRDADVQAKSAQDAVNARANVSTDTAYRDNQKAGALQGGLLQGLKDVSMTRPSGIPTANIQGGLRPSAIVGAQGMGEQFQRDAMARYLAGAPGLHGDSPELSKLPQAGKFDKFLNIVGGIGGLAGLAQNAGIGGGGGVPEGVSQIQGAAPLDKILGSGVNADVARPDALNPTLQANTRRIRFGG